MADGYGRYYDGGHDAELAISNDRDETKRPFHCVNYFDVYY